MISGIIDTEESDDMSDKIRKIIPFTSAVLLVTAMTASSGFSGEKEILFPEIAAIAAGGLVTDKLAWNTSYSRLFGSIALGSIIGVLIVLFLPLPLFAQMSAAFLAASLLLEFSGTSFAPMISAIVLPVMLQTKSVVYPISAVSLTGLIIETRILLEKNGLCSKPDFERKELPDKRELSELITRWLAASMVITIAMGSRLRFLAAPPLLVAFTEFCHPNSKAMGRPVQTGLVITLSAFTGAVMRYVFLSFGAYQFIAAALTVTAVFIMMKKLDMFIPPAAALSVLAYLIPEEALLTYPLQIAAGSAVFILLAAALVKAEAFHRKVVEKLS